MRTYGSWAAWQILQTSAALKQSRNRNNWEHCNGNFTNKLISSSELPPCYCDTIHACLPYSSTLNICLWLIPWKRQIITYGHSTLLQLEHCISVHCSSIHWPAIQWSARWTSTLLSQTKHMHNMLHKHTYHSFHGDFPVSQHSLFSEFKCLGYNTWTEENNGVHSPGVSTVGWKVQSLVR